MYKKTKADYEDTKERLDEELKRSQLEWEFKNTNGDKQYRDMFSEIENLKQAITKWENMDINLQKYFFFPSLF